MFRRYESKWQRFAQPDPYDGSYNLADPQSLNRYAYVQNDGVNFTDPSGLLPNEQCPLDGSPCNIYSGYSQLSVSCVRGRIMLATGIGCLICRELVSRVGVVVGAL